MPGHFLFVDDIIICICLYVRAVRNACMYQWMDGWMDQFYKLASWIHQCINIMVVRLDD